VFFTNSFGGGQPAGEDGAPVLQNQSHLPLDLPIEASRLCIARTKSVRKMMGQGAGASQKQA
jgi:hypothetical protein